MRAPISSPRSKRWIGRAAARRFPRRARRRGRPRDGAKGSAQSPARSLSSESLPADLPKAVVSSSSHSLDPPPSRPYRARATRSATISISGREHVDARQARARSLSLRRRRSSASTIADCAIIEDSPVGATGAVASGGYVIGLCAGNHCAPDHADRLRALGVARHRHRLRRGRPADRLAILAGEQVRAQRYRVVIGIVRHRAEQVRIEPECVAQLEANPVDIVAATGPAISAMDACAMSSASRRPAGSGSSPR